MQLRALRRLLNHHAVTPLWDEKSKAELAQWFSDNGFNRGYGGNPNNWSGLINPFTGERSYSQTGFVGQRVTDRTPDATAAERKAGYRVFPIVKNAFGVATWHSGNYDVNLESVAIEHLGDYRNYDLRPGDVTVIADFWRPIDKEKGGQTWIQVHFQIFPTECPARIAKSQQAIIDAVNNGVQPAPAPTPAPAPAPTPKPVQPGQTIIRGSVVRPRVARSYDGVGLAAHVTKNNYPVIEIYGNRAVLGNGLNTAFNTNDLQLIANGGGSAAPVQKSIDQLAQEVIALQWGSGDDRKARLGSRYNEVQARVNEILLGGSKPVGKPSISAGDRVQPINAISYEGVHLSAHVTRTVYPVIEVRGDRVVLGGGLNTAFAKSNLRKV